MNAPEVWVVLRTHRGVVVPVAVFATKRGACEFSATHKLNMPTHMFECDYSVAQYAPKNSSFSNPAE